jgi:hypothetical protein
MAPLLAAGTPAGLAVLAGGAAAALATDLAVLDEVEASATPGTTQLVVAKAPASAARSVFRAGALLTGDRIA